MKRLLVILTAVLLAISCAKEAPEAPNGGAVELAPLLNNFELGKAPMGTPLDLAGLKALAAGFGVSTSGLPGTNMSNLAVTYSTATSKWSFTGTYYWPINPAQNVTFTAYAPRGASGFTLSASGLSASNYAPSTNINSHVDVLYAPPTNFTQGSHGSSGVPLAFSHIFTQVVVAVTTNVPASQNPRISSIQLVVPYGRGNFLNGVWTPINSSRTYTLMSNTNLSIGSTKTSSPAFLVPLSSFVAGTQLRITKIVGGSTRTRVVELNTSSVTSWQMGYKVLYNVHITTSPTFAANGVSDHSGIDVEAVTANGFDW